jgi:hypothetical protein
MQVDDDFAARAAAVAREIESAFAGVKHPGLDAMVLSPKDYESQEIRQSFGNRHWRDLPFSMISYHREAFARLTPAAYPFYLPAYMRAALSPESAADDICVYTVYALAPSSWSNPREIAFFEERYQRLTEPQRNAVRSFLRFIGEQWEGYLGEHAFDQRRSVWMRPA